MRVGRFEFVADRVTKFFSYLRIEGWFHGSNDNLTKVIFKDSSKRDVRSRILNGYPGVDRTPCQGFIIEVFRNSESSVNSALVEFVTQRRKKVQVSLSALCEDRISRYPSNDLARRFKEQTDRSGMNILDIGGRARSRVDRSSSFNNANCVVLDVLPGENVDVVGDAHRLAELFPSATFDAVVSVSVFEHLSFPWVVANQMNQILKTGGIGLIHSHQTLGLHDMPMDYWRFSDTAWQALFNHSSGFEIVDTSLDYEQFIIPFVFRESKSDAEKSAGFEGSSVWVRKTHDVELMRQDQFGRLDHVYPENDDGFRGDSPRHLK